MEERLRRCQIGPKDTVRAAMQALETASCGLVLVVNPQGVLAGVMTDGDIRRALLAGAALDSPVTPHFQRSFTFVTPQDGRASVIELMHSRMIEQIPIVDQNGRLVGLHLLNEMVGAVARPNWAVVMAGGRGSRLGALTRAIPKPMIPVAGRPILERIVLHLVGFGIRRIYLAVHYLSEVVEDHFRDGAQFGCQIHYLREETPIGTAGALSLLPEPPRHPLLVMNGDLVTQADLGAMFDLHAAQQNQITVGVRQYDHQVPFGCLELEQGRVLAITEKPTLSRTINAGIYILNPTIVAAVPPDQEVFMTDVLEQTMQEHLRVGAFEIVGDWIDVGQPQQLKAAREGDGRELILPLPVKSAIAAPTRRTA